MSVNDTEFFRDYLTALRRTPTAEKTEYTDRSALETLLQRVADKCSTLTKVQHEPRRAQDKGAPDFKITRQGAIVGYVEAKRVGENLDAILRTDQIKRYLELNPNLLVTDYLRFIWIKDGKLKDAQSARLCEASALEGKLAPLDPDRVAEVEKLLVGFFKTAPKGVKRASELADALAVRSRLLRDFLSEELQRQEKEEEGGRLLGLYKAFKEQVSHELKLHEFADAFAQTLAYGLFLAKLNSPKRDITLANAEDHVPGGFSLIRELVGFLRELGKDEYAGIEWVVGEILIIVNTMEVDAIRDDLSFKNQRAYSRSVRARSEEEWRLFRKDPFVYFYEDYLEKYDKSIKIKRGVYYTPPPIVNFIVRAINDILKDKFEIVQGLADRERVTVLDFACGTGTFLVEVLERIFEEIGGAGAGVAPSYVREHILENVYGFEYLIAPYTIAHLKLSQYLSELAQRSDNPSIALRKDERFQVYLTNTLEPIDPQANLLLPELTKETAGAQKVKERRILVVTGNPPYAGHSKNPSERDIVETVHERRTKRSVVKLKEPKEVRRKVKTAIGKLIEDYKVVDGRPLGEQNPKWLQDDYVKFLRFAQDKMQREEEGIVGVITNHSYLDNPTFRGMRQSLTETFDQIYILDLHGSTKPKELVPEGEENENVFDIRKGVAIALFVKRPGIPKGVWHADVWGNRLQKYQTAANASFEGVNWKKVECFSPYYMFKPLDWTHWAEYEPGWPVSDVLNAAREKRQIFDLNVLGFQTHRDHFAVGWDRASMEGRVQDMIDTSMSDRSLRAKYEIVDNRDWKLAEARKALQGMRDPHKPIIRCAYRPFDRRFCFFGEEFMDYPRRELLDHVSPVHDEKRKNLQLLVSRQIGTANWRHAFVAVEPANDCLISDQSREANQAFLLWRFAGSSKLENLSAAFREFADGHYGHHYAPEQVLGYIYAILHTPTYRVRYADFLRIDFPRIPFAENAEDFEELSELGSALVEAHLLRKLERRGLGKYQGTKQGEDEHRVVFVRYAEAEQAVYINDKQRFAPIPPEVWNFHIGGYQVLDKYLTRREQRVLSLDEQEHVPKVADALAFTIEQMAAIDEAYKAAFPQQSGGPG